MAQTPRVPNRTMTVADLIELNTFGSQPHGYLPQDIDVPSPDGRIHAVVVKRGNVNRNTNVFSLLLFRTEALFSEPAPDTVLTLASSSNRPAISSLKWLSDNRNLAFLGERPDELPQVYTLDIRTHRLIQLTHQTTEITIYDIAPSGDPIVYAAEPAVDSSRYASMRQRGFAVRPTQFVADVLMGRWSESAGALSEPQFFAWHSGTAPVEMSVPGQSYRWCDRQSVSVAPSGRVALIRCKHAGVPARWRGYTEPDLARLVANGASLPEFALLDLNRGTVEPLLDAPAFWSTTFRWAPTGESVVLANAFLPLDVPDPAEQRARAARPGIAEVDVSTHRLTVIAHRDSLDVVAWDSASNTVDFVPGRYGVGRLDGQRVRYRKTAHGWTEIRGGRAPSRPMLAVEQGLNLPPRLVALDRAAKRHAVVLDPNPQLAALRLSHEEIVRWRSKSGQERVGGLYFPPDFVRGHRYPLVIQTHGFDSTTFAPDGIFPTANAAQPMAAQGMLVLQVGAGLDGTWVGDLGTAQEAPNAMEEIEGAIDHFDSLALIDRSRVGLIAFSRTCFHVLYALTHSRYPIAAAAATSGVDFSYLQYMLFRNAAIGVGVTQDEYQGINGGPPLGKGLDAWWDRAPGFNLDRVTTPLRLEAIRLSEVLGAWEPYAGLLLQNKPVELFVLPEGEHLLVKPWERLASSQGNVDWFRFWLKGEEDPDPAKADQYVRWRELRKLQQQQTPDTGAARQ